MQLLPGLIPLWRGDGTCQIGADSRLAFRLTGLDPNEHRMLDALASGTVHGPGREEVERLARQHGVPVARARRLLDHLRGCGVLREDPVIADPGETSHDPALAVRSCRVRAIRTHLGLLSLAAHSAQPGPVDPRQRAAVAVVGGGALGIGIALHLVQAGVGAAWIDDDAPVEEGDVQWGGFRISDIGRSRSMASRALLRAVNPRLAGPRSRPDAVVLVEANVAVPFRSSGLQREDIPHLSVVARELDIVVGPLVRPGHDACLRCLDLHRCEADSAWPAMATQLAVTPTHPLPGYITSAAAALAVAEVLALLDGRDVALSGVTVEVGLDAVGVHRRWTAHPECGCGAG